MKKVFLGFAAMALAASMFMTSCDNKIVSSEDKIDTTQTAKIIINTGVVQKLGDEAVPMSGQANVILSVANNTLGASAASNGSYLQTVSLNGDKIEIDVPVTSDGVTYTLTFNDFVAPYNDGTNTVNYIYKGALIDGLTVGTLKPGQVTAVKVKYTGTKEAKVK